MDVDNINPATLLWCRIGRAVINAPDRILHVAAGDLIIAPQGAIVTASAEASILSLKFPDSTLIGPTRKLSLGPDWERRMIAEYSRSVLGEQTLSPTLSALVDASRFAAPSLPTGAAARAVAQRLVANPSERASLMEFAQDYHVSARTLQRQFLQSTGLPFSEWRAACRVACAADMLARGRTIADAATRVGFDATSSLTRAFRRHTGTTPAAFINSVRIDVPSIDPLTVFARAERDLVLWIAVGTATVTTPGYCRFMGQGETVTILAGTQTRLDIAAGSIALPVPVGFDETQPCALNRALLTGVEESLAALEEPLRARLVPVSAEFIGN